MAATTTPKGDIRIGFPEVKVAGVTSIALGVSVAIVAFASQVAIGAGKSLVTNTKAVLESAKV